MNRNILKFTNLVLFVLSLIYISNIIYENFNELKNTLQNLKYLNIYYLAALTIINTFFGNYLTYILIKPFIKLKLNEFTEINLNSNLLNQLLPFFGTIYKGYILNKFNFSYSNYINLILLTRVLQIYFVFILSLFLIVLFEENSLIKLIIIIAIIIQFLILIFLKSLKFKYKYFQNKYFKNLKTFLASFNLIKKNVFISIIIMRITDFFIFFVLVDNIMSVDIKIILIMYVLRFFIIHLPVLGNSTTAVVATTFTFSFMDLSFLESFLINFLHSIIIVIGTIICLVINYIFKKFSNYENT
jgi:hypothetical protein